MFYETQSFITTFTSTCHLSLFSPRSSSHFLQIHFNIILPSKPCPFKWFLPLGLFSETLYELSCYPFVPHALTLVLLDMITRVLVTSTERKVPYNM